MKTTPTNGTEISPKQKAKMFIPCRFEFNLNGCFANVHEVFWYFKNSSNSLENNEVFFTFMKHSDKVFKNGPSKICGKQTISLQFFKGCLPQISLDLFLNTLSHSQYPCQ